MNESKHIHAFLDKVGRSVQNINTVAVALSNLPHNPSVDKALNITWKPHDVKKAAIEARHFTLSAVIVFAVESLYEYLESLSEDPSWEAVTTISFIPSKNSKESKAERMKKFFSRIDAIPKEWIILVELLCHWRNRIVHNSSNAKVGKGDLKYLLEKEEEIKNDFYKFSVSQAIDDFENTQITLKDTTTLITFILKCCKKTEKHYTDKLKQLNVYKINIQDSEFLQIVKSSKSEKRTRQIQRYISLHFAALGPDQRKLLSEKYT